MHPAVLTVQYVTVVFRLSLDESGSLSHSLALIQGEVLLSDILSEGVFVIMNRCSKSRSSSFCAFHSWFVHLRLF